MTAATAAASSARRRAHLQWTVIRCIGTAGATIMMTVRGTEKRNTVNTRGMILSVIRRTTPQPVPPAIPIIMQSIS